MVSAIPQHIGVILDGNRRYARALLRQPWAGHRLGLAKAREVLEWTCEAGIKHITAYVLSLENLASRPKRELHFILKCLGEEADAMYLVLMQSLSRTSTSRSLLLERTLADWSLSQNPDCRHCRKNCTMLRNEQPGTTTTRSTSLLPMAAARSSLTQ